MTKQQEETMENPQDKAWVNVERTVNLGNYENIKISVGGSRTISENEDLVEIRKDMTEEALDEVDELAKYYKEKR
jgi:hypothetical protein